MLLPISLNAQENKQFVRSFTQYASSDENNEFGEFKPTKITIVFNYGDGNDVKLYSDSEEFLIYRRISSVTEGTTPKGRNYSSIKTLDEEGHEVAFVLYYDDGEVRMLYKNLEDNSLLLAISFIP